MELRTFSAVNLARCISGDGFRHSLDAWSIAEWTNAVAGEVGEACNYAKKLLRHRDGLAGNVKTDDMEITFLRKQIACELADVIVYADLAIAALGLNTADVLAEVFNKKSVAIGAPYVV